MHSCSSLSPAPFFPVFTRLALPFLFLALAFHATVLQAQDEGIPARIDATSVRVRASGSTKAAVVTSLKKGTEVRILEEKNDWSRIRSGDVEGWIKSSLLERISTERPTGAAAVTPSSSGGITLYTDQPVPELDAIDPVAYSPGLGAAVLLEAAVTLDGAELRAYPGTQATVLANLPQRAAVVVLDRNERWVKCEYEGITGWLPREQVALRGTRMLPGLDDGAGFQHDAELRAAVERIEDEELRLEALTALEREQRLRASVSALLSRAQAGGSNSLGVTASSEFFLATLTDDATALGLSCRRLADLSDEGQNGTDRDLALRVTEKGQVTLQQFEQVIGQARSAPPSPVTLYGGQFSFAMGSHTRTAIYDYSTSAPTLQATAWMNTPAYGNFRARLDYADDIVTTKFIRTNVGVDWRIPMVSQQWSARVNMYRYDDDLPTNTYDLYDVHAGWEQLRQDGPALFARMMYQGKGFQESQPQDFAAYSLNAGLRSLNAFASGYEVNLLNRYQSSDDMGLNFDMFTAYGLWRNQSGFSVRPAYEGYFSLADSGGTFLNYHRPGVELRWSRPSGVTDYGARLDYRYHPDAENLTFGQASLFAGHQGQGLLGTNWHALLMYQMNNGFRNPSFIQSNLDARSTAELFFIGFNSVLRYVLTEDDDSLSQHFTDMYLNPGVVVKVGEVRIQTGPFVGMTIFANNKVPALKDNLNNSARAGLSLHAMASITSRVNIRAWGEYERAFHFSEDPYVGRKREPTRLRLGAEGTVSVTGALSAFVRAQTYSINNDTGIKINLPTGERDRDRIDDTLLLIGLRYHL